MRVILGFLITLHACRKLFGVLEPVAGRRSFTLDALPSFTGYLDLIGGALIMAGLFVRPTALVLSLEALIAYVFIAQPRTLWPIRNGGIEALLYVVVFLYLAAAGAGVWSGDTLLRRPSRRDASCHTI
jgi:putative oxidoreductase